MGASVPLTAQGQFDTFSKAAASVGLVLLVWSTSGYVVETQRVFVFRAGIISLIQGLVLLAAVGISNEANKSHDQSSDGLVRAALILLTGLAVILFVALVALLIGQLLGV